MLLKTVVSLTLCAGGLAMAAGSVESEFVPDAVVFPTGRQESSSAHFLPSQQSRAEESGMRGSAAGSKGAAYRRQALDTDWPY